MPISHTLDQTRGQMRTTVTGPVTADEILTHFETARREQALTYAELIDARGATEPIISVAEVWRVASAVRKSQVGQNLGRRAVIVTNDAAFGMTRMFAALVSDSFPMNVFRDQKEAEKWLSESPAEDAG